MKYVDEFRQSSLVMKWAAALAKITTRPWTIMEVCGGQTHSIVKFGLNNLLPDKIRLIHGPGCPVCVTPMSLIDHALHIAKQQNVIFCSYGDMLRVPGTLGDLLTLKAKGADVRVVLSPLDAAKLAKENQQRPVVFFAVGFETTAPPNGMAARLAKQLGLKNFSLLASHVLVPPAINFLLNSPENEVQGFLAAGHVCTITGCREYYPIAQKYRVPIVITGFEPLDILQGLYFCIEQLEKGEWKVQNQYTNLYAQAILNEVFEVADREWRGIGSIPLSGLALQKEYAAFDAALKFPFIPAPAKENGCISGLILQGKKKPCECALFGKECTPESPFGAPMVSNEGACSAYYHHRSKL
jgi:hydrogenase expression/formation protein HypD